MKKETTVKALCAKTAEMELAHVVAKAGSKTASKSIAKVSASPMLYAADVAEAGTRIVTTKAGLSEETSIIAAKGASYGTAAVVGLSVAGPVGAVTAVGIQVAADVVSEHVSIDEINEIGRTIRKSATGKSAKKYLGAAASYCEPLIYAPPVNPKEIKRAVKKAKKVIGKLLDRFYF